MERVHGTMVRAGIFLFLMAVPVMFFLCLPRAEAAEFAGAWKYREGGAFDSTDAQVLQEAWLESAMRGDAAWTSYGFPDHPRLSSSSVRDIWVTVRLRPDWPEKNVLLFSLAEQSIRVWLDHQLIYSYGSLADASHAGGSRWHMIVLPELQREVQLTFRLHANDVWQLGYFNRMQIDTEAAQLRAIYLNDLPYLVSLPVALVLLLLMMGYYVKRIAWRRLCAAICAFLVFFILWLICALNMKYIFFDAPAFWWYMMTGLEYLFPIAANWILYELLERNLKPWAMGVIASYAALFFMAVAGELLGFSGMERLMPVYYILLLLAEPVAFIMVLTSAYGGNPYSRAVLIPMIGITALGALDALSWYFYLFSWSSFVSSLGIYFFALFMLGMLHEQFTMEKRVSQRAIALREKREKVEAQAILDPLTGCYNRARMENLRERAIFQSEQRGLPMGMMILDIDHFKRFNDNYGHEMGDMVLRGFAEVIRENILPEMILIRWGGEEFVVFCPACPLFTTAAFAEVVRGRVMSAVLCEKQQVTCSIGITLWQGGEDTAAEMFQRADQALYRAKESGRNRIAVEL